MPSGRKRFTDRGLADTVVEGDGGNTKRQERLCEKRLGAAVERLRMHDDIARPCIGKQARRDRGHARGEQDCGIGSLVDRQAILDDLAVGVIEARIDEAGPRTFGWRASSRDIIEEILALFGRAEDERRSEKNRRLHRPFGQHRIVAVAEHQRLGPQHMIPDTRLGRAWLGH